MRILANLGKFGKGLRLFWENLGKVYDIFGLLYWIFWAIILIFSGKKGQPTHKWPGTPMEKDMLSTNHNQFSFSRPVFERVINVN